MATAGEPTVEGRQGPVVATTTCGLQVVVDAVGATVTVVEHGVDEAVALPPARRVTTLLVVRILEVLLTGLGGRVVGDGAA